MSATRRATVLLALTLTAAPLAACGSSSSGGSTAPSTSTTTTTAKPAANELVTKTIAAAKATKSVKLKADSQAGSFEMAGLTDGTNQHVMSTSTKASTNEKVELLRVGGASYIKALDAATATSLKLPAASVGKYMKYDAAGVMLDLFGMKTMWGALTTESGYKDLTTGTVTDVTEQGAPAWKVSGKSTGKTPGEDVSVTVSADGKYRILAFAGQDTKITVTDHDAVKPFEAPAAGEIFTP